MASEGPAPAKRPEAGIVIWWNPNSGELGYKASGMNPMEELGVLSACQDLRNAQIRGAAAQPTIQVAAGPLPAAGS